MSLRALTLAALLASTAFHDSLAQRSPNPHFLPAGWPDHQWPYVGPWQLLVSREGGPPVASLRILITPDSLEYAGNDLFPATCRACLAASLPPSLWDSLHLRRALATTWEFQVSPTGHLLGQAPGRQTYSAGALEFEGYWDGDSLRGFWHEFRPQHHRYGRFVLTPLASPPPPPPLPHPHWEEAPILEFAPTHHRFRVLADSLAQLDPRTQVQLALARGDRRALVLQTQIPGILVDHYPYVREQLGTLLLPWTSDIVAGSTHRRWQRAADRYARRYNRLLWAAVGLR